MADSAEYREETREAYRSGLRVAAYDRQLRGWTWMGWTMARECHLVGRALRRCQLPTSARVLDLPCGTGVLAQTFAAAPVTVVAADVSSEMLRLARSRYAPRNNTLFVAADALTPPFLADTFDCVVVIGFFHRLPDAERRLALTALRRCSQRYLIASFSLDGPARRLKLGLIKALRPGFQSAPAPVSLEALWEDFRAVGLRVVARWAVAPPLSSESVFLLERVDPARPEGVSRPHIL
ncbi:MAG: class I SAM-dependent methyltransferase [Rhodospirillaceae bacterium]